MNMQTTEMIDNEIKSMKRCGDKECSCCILRDKQIESLVTRMIESEQERISYAISKVFSVYEQKLIIERKIDDIVYGK